MTNPCQHVKCVHQHDIYPPKIQAKVQVDEGQCFARRNNIYHILEIVSYATIYERAKMSDKAKDNGKYAYFKSAHNTSPNMFTMHNGLVNSGYRSHLFS